MRGKPRDMPEGEEDEEDKPGSARASAGAGTGAEDRDWIGEGGAPSAAVDVELTGCCG